MTVARTNRGPCIAGPHSGRLDAHRRRGRSTRSRQHPAEEQRPAEGGGHTERGFDDVAAGVRHHPPSRAGTALAVPHAIADPPDDRGGLDDADIPVGIVARLLGSPTRRIRGPGRLAARGLAAGAECYPTRQATRSIRVAARLEPSPRPSTSRRFSFDSRSGRRQSSRIPCRYLPYAYCMAGAARSLPSIRPLVQPLIPHQEALFDAVLRHS